MQVDIRQAIYLAALLHDIGKFWQRASERDETLSASTKNLEADLCPKFNERYSHKHVLWTSEFFEKFSSVFPQQVEFEENTLQIGNLSARHHKRNLKGTELIIAFADKLSSGHDRREKEEKKLAEIEHRDYDKFKKTRLQNIFDNLFASSEESIQKSFFPLTNLKLDTSIFAVKSKGIDNEAFEEYKKLWEDFEKQIGKLPKGNFDALATSLLSILKSYTWCIPSSTIDQPDISLFDHLKTTAAIAVSLYDSQKIHGNIPSILDGFREEDIKRFSLIGGDFSGIQNFIYQITSRAAAKTLKGRSFYLQVMMDSILQRIKDIYELQDAHVLFSSGGRFYVLAPNIPDNWQQTVSLSDEVNSKLDHRYGGTLYLAISKIDFPASLFLDENGYPELIEKLQSALEEEKSHRFYRQINSSIDFFEPDDLKGTTADDICRVTGIDLYPDEEFIEPEKRNRASKDSPAWKGEEGSISIVAEEQILLGRSLRDARWMVRYNRNRKRNNYSEFGPLELGYTYRFYNKENLKSNDLENADSVIALNNTENYLIENPGIGCTFQYYGAAWTPRDSSEEVLDFTEIAKDNKVDALGILRMDVDNLGKTFKDGFQKDNQGNTRKSQASISRATTLSSQLDWFFSGYLNHLLSGGFNPEGSGLELSPDKPDPAHPYGRHLYPVYAGGDDVFIVTRWDLAPILAKQIYEDFKKFTNYHSNLTISCGISVIQPKSPIHKGAADAGEAESQAKKLAPTGKKDAITWLGYSLGWEDFDLVCNLVKEFKKLVDNMKTRAMVGLLRNTSSDYLMLKHLKEQEKNTTDPLYGRWRWRAAYQLTRMKKTHKVLEELNGQGIGGEVFLTGTYNGQKPQRPEETDIVEILPLVTRWLTLLTRTTRKN